MRRRGRGRGRVDHYDDITTLFGQLRKMRFLKQKCALELEKCDSK